MGIGFGGIRHVKVDDMGDTQDINATGGYIGCHQNLVRTVPKAVESLLPFLLGKIPLQRGGTETGLFQMQGQTFRLMLGAGENEGALYLLLMDYALEQRGFLRRGDLKKDMGDSRGRQVVVDLHGRRVYQELLGQMTDFVGHGGGKNQRLAFSRHQLDDPSNIRQEALVEHMVGFIQHQYLNGAETERLIIDQVEQATRTGDDYLHSGPQGSDLRSFAHSTINDDAVQTGLFAHHADILMDLLGEFPGRCDDQGPYFLAGAGQQTLEQGKNEGCGLAGSGLGKAKDVAAGEDRRDSIFLDRGGGGVTAGINARFNGLVELKIFKTH
ncbi:MAG: hypothetical protein ACD_75C01808G0009 [uncultured bacterium]|nr:MAG: hypothetical protein ACD_75C01808G0009 [uncultured bacterium]